MKKTTGWLIVILGILWAVVVIRQVPPAGPDGLGTSRLIGALTPPVLTALVGLYVAGVIKGSKKG
jgi:hypothetical protein